MFDDTPYACELAARLHARAAAGDATPQSGPIPGSAQLPNDSSGRAWPASAPRLETRRALGRRPVARREVAARPRLSRRGLPVARRLLAALGGTDHETWAGAVHPAQALRAYRERTGIAAKLVVVAIASSGFSIADPDDAGMLDVVGLDAATPQAVADFAA